MILDGPFKGNGDEVDKQLSRQQLAVNPEQNKGVLRAISFDCKQSIYIGERLLKGISQSGLFALVLPLNK
jgi:hypothetical protein